MRKIISALVAAIFGLMLTAAPILAQTPITATVTVSTVCELNVNINPIGFGDLAQTQSSGIKTKDVTLTTNTPATVSISGDTWTGPHSTMPVSQTKYDLNLTSGDPTTPLGSGATLFGPVTTNTGGTVSLQVTIPAVQRADTYTQHITFTLSCP